ncbi:MAG: hypothetical protein DRG59_08490 [Deltaproteobacteria bacterium]|nr:MAG: hypothetical protein DRG59_08490 [Deltaproteobacteria bacterium]
MITYAKFVHQSKYLDSRQARLGRDFRGNDVDISRLLFMHYPFVIPAEAGIQYYWFKKLCGRSIIAKER